LKSFDMRRRCDDDTSLRPSSEFWRLLRRSMAPSLDLRNKSSLPSLLAIETVDESGPFDCARGAASVLSLSLEPNMEPMLLRRSEAIVEYIGYESVQSTEKRSRVSL
jgi:hypothetical protein